MRLWGEELEGGPTERGGTVRMGCGGAGGRDWIRRKRK